MIQRTFIVALTLAALAIGVMWVGSIRWTLAYIGRGYGIGIGGGGICVYGLVLRRSSNDGLRWVAWLSEAPPWYPRAGMPAPDFVGLGHGTHHMRCEGPLDVPFVQRVGIALPANATRQTAVTERTHV